MVTWVTQEFRAGFYFSCFSTPSFFRDAYFPTDLFLHSIHTLSKQYSGSIQGDVSLLTLAIPWVHLGYTLGTPWLNLG